MVEIAVYHEKEHFRNGKNWKVNLFGARSAEPKADLQAFRVDMNADETLDSHMHIVDQFQLFIEGSGKIGRDNAELITAHYADHHTGYGPIIAGPQGLSYLTLRPKTDAGMVRLSSPNVRDQLKPSKRRHGMSAPIVRSIGPVLHDRTELSVETVLGDRSEDEGMFVKVVRLAPGMTYEAPSPAGSGGYYLVVMNGSLAFDGKECRLWSALFLRPGDAAPLLVAGEEGLEAIILQFPREDDWMRDLGAAANE